MSVYDANGIALLAAYDIDSNQLLQAYDVNGNELLTSWIDNLPNSGYSFTDGTNTYATKLMFDFNKTSFQSVVFDSANNKFYRASTDNKVYPYDSNFHALSVITLPSTGGHKNDGCYYDGKIYWVDGVADSPTALFIWDISVNTISQVSPPISDNPNGSKRIVAGICNAGTEGTMYLVTRDKYNDDDVAHQSGDVMCVYSYNVANNTVQLVASFDWDCVYVQGATFVDEYLYAACNTQTAGSASNYTGITIKVIDPSAGTIVKTLTCSGDFEPQGCDHITIGDDSYIWTGLSKYNAVDKVIVFEAVRYDQT